MAGKRKKPIHPAIQELMDQGGHQDLRSLSKAYKIPERGLYNLADGSGSNAQLALHLLVAQKLGISLDDWVKKYINV